MDSGQWTGHLPKTILLQFIQFLKFRQDPVDGDDGDEEGLKVPKYK